MASTITIDLTNTLNAIKGIANIDRSLFKAATLVKGHLVKSWLTGKGGDGIAMKPLTGNYANKKATAGRTPIANLNFTGLMQQSLTPVKRTKTRVDVTFLTAAQQQKADGNHKTRPNMMSLSNSIVDRVTNLILRDLQGK